MEQYSEIFIDIFRVTFLIIKKDPNALFTTDVDAIENDASMPLESFKADF